MVRVKHVIREDYNVSKKTQQRWKCSKIGIRNKSGNTGRRGLAIKVEIQQDGNSQWKWEMQQDGNSQ